MNRSTPAIASHRKSKSKARSLEIASIVNQLSGIVGTRYVITGPELEPFAHDATFLEATPDIAVLPGDTTETSEVLRVCDERSIPVVARGSGTSLVGGPIALAGGVVLSLERLRTIEIDSANVCAVVGAGSITAEVHAAARAKGLMYPPDPASLDMSSIGGNLACNSGGPSCLKYGLTADYVLGMTVVLAGGQVLSLGGRTRKRASGYRLAQLFVGSEGTLGVITEATLKLLPNPPYRATALVGFDDSRQAADAVARLMGSGYLPAALELMDREALAVVKHLLPPGLRSDRAAVLLIEQDGIESDVVQNQLEAMVERLGGDDNRIAQSASERDKLWSARRSFAKVLMAMPKNFFSEDVSVPISAVPDMLARITEISAETGLRIPVVGHAGDGNLHPTFVFDDGQRQLVGAAAVALFDHATSLGGSISGEHGLGALKRDHSVLEHTQIEFRLMKQIKAVFDPKAMLNPHKIFPELPADSSFLDRLPGWSRGRHSEIGD